MAQRDRPERPNRLAQRDRSGQLRGASLFGGFSRFAPSPFATAPFVPVVLAAILLAVTTLPARVSADPVGSPDTEIGPGPHASVEWLIETPLVPGGFTRTAVLFHIEDGWHTYGNAQNDTGFPARFEPNLPPGVTVMQEVWPTPERHVSPGNILDHVYEGETAVFLDLLVSPSTAPGSIELGLKVDWLVCREACVFEGDSLVVAATVTTPMAIVPPSDSPRTAPFLARIPKPSSGRGLEVERREAEDGDVVHIRVPGARQLTFIPALDGAVLRHAIEDGAAEGSVLDLRIESGSAELKGTLEVHRAGSTEYLRIP